MEVRVLGPLELVDGDGAGTGDDDVRVVLPGAKMRGLLVLLALEAGRVVPVERIVDALSGDELPQRATNAIQQLVSKLRRALPPSGADAVVTRAPGYLLDVPSSAVDALRFERLLVDGRAAAASGDHVAASVVLAEALGLWRGDALVDVPFDGAVAAARTRLGELRLSAAEDRADSELALGRHDGLVAELESMVQAEPLRERRWGQLILALYRAGRQADALRAYQRARAELAEQLGIDPGPELRRLEQAVLAQDASLAAPASPLVTVAAPAEAPAVLPMAPAAARSARAGRVRRPLTSCLGRDDAIAHVGQLVSRERLVTLVGPGGAGKTRLATEVALAIGDRVPDGVWWVELAPVVAAGVVPAIGRALGLDGGPGGATGDDTDTHADALESRSVVLALDNCEHVVAEVAMVVDELLARAPQLRVVATSREGLGVPGEIVFVVPPLQEADAVTLFTQRATATGVALAADELAPSGPVFEICRRLDGLPLAIELAAARARHVGVEELVHRLDQRFEVLTDGPRVAQSRQRTLRAVVDWSYELLSEPERELFEGLGVFAGPVGLDGITRVCTGDPGAAPAVERLLGQLVDKSLVVVDRSSSPTRFGMLQTLSEYARDRLRERGDERLVRDRHARWIRDRATAVAFDAPAGDHRLLLAALQRDDAEVQQALTWAMAADPDVALEICAGMGWPWFVGLQARAAWAAHTTALAAAPAARSELRSRVAAFVGIAGDMCGQPDAGSYAAAAVADARRSADPATQGLAVLLQGFTATLRMEAKASLVHFEAALACFTTAGHARGLACVRLGEGTASLLRGDLVDAEVGLREAGAAFRELGDHLGTLAVLVRVGDLAYRLRHYDEAVAAMAEIVALGGSPALMGAAQGMIGVAEARAGHREEARRAAALATAHAAEGCAPVATGFARYASGMARLLDGDVHAGRADLEAAARYFDPSSPALTATCWLELSKSWEPDDPALARTYASRALDLALQTDDAMIRERASAHAATLDDRA